MAGTGTVTFAGTYVEERPGNLILSTTAGVYIEKKPENHLLLSFVGIYVEENWDAAPIIVSTDGEETPIFGLVVR